MTESSPTPPQDLQEQAEQLAEQTHALAGSVGERIDQLQTAGATPDERYELDRTGELLRGAGAEAVRAADAIEEAEIPERVRRPETAEPEIDEEAVYDLVKQFIDRKGTGIIFSATETQVFLEDNGYVLDVKRVRSLFKQWKDEILTEYLERGERVQWQSLKGKVNGKNDDMYVLAAEPGRRVPLLSSQLPDLKNLPRRESTISPELQASLPLSSSRERSNLAEDERQAVLNIITSHIDRKARAIKNQIANQLGIEPNRVQGIVQSLVDRGSLYTGRRGGSSFYSLEPVERRRAPASAPRRETFTDRDAELTDKLMTTLLTFREASARGLTARDLAQAMNEEGIEESEVKRIARKLRSLNLAEYNEAGRASRGSAPRVVVPANMRRDYADPEFRLRIIAQLRDQAKP